MQGGRVHKAQHRPGEFGFISPLTAFALSLSLSLHTCAHNTLESKRWAPETSCTLTNVAPNLFFPMWLSPYFAPAHPCLLEPLLPAACRMVLCGLGTYSGPGFSACKPCPGGTFGGSRGITDPVCSGVCTAGHTCPPGSVTPTQEECPAGKYSVGGASSCTMCPPGR